MNELEAVESKDLSVRFSDSAVKAMSEQRSQLKNFVSSQMVKDVDFGTIPGTPKPSLYKPGAEKLMNIFQLGSRKINVKEVIDHEKNYAMFTYTMEVFHIPSGKGIAQCEASANSFEKKYKEKTKYDWIYDENLKKKVKKEIGKEPILIGDILNTLQKMAQKRAIVGATISATGASDFFTQDVEDMRGSGVLPEVENLDPDTYIIRYGKLKDQALKTADKIQLNNYLKWINTLSSPNKGLLAEKDMIESFLNVIDTEPPIGWSGSDAMPEPPKFNDKEDFPF